jgi:hypothetical protein
VSLYNLPTGAAMPRMCLDVFGGYVGWGNAVNQVHTLASDLCVGINGGPSDHANVRAEQRPCAADATANADQRWYMVVNPVARPQRRQFGRQRQIAARPAGLT